jgi:hypothetical protein
MTILYQVQAELMTAAKRPPLRTRISIRVVAVMIAAILALLIAAPPSIAGLAGSASLVSTQMAR